MNFNQKILEANQKLFDLISTKDITFLKDLDSRINIIKKGKFKYYKIISSEIEGIRNFIINLEPEKIYTLIPIISINDRKDQPFMVLSEQILVTSKTNALLLSNYINEKIITSEDLFNMNDLNRFYTIFKYKSFLISLDNLKHQVYFIN